MKEPEKSPSNSRIENDKTYWYDDRIRNGKVISVEKEDSYQY